MGSAVAAVNGALAGALLQKVWADNAGRLCLKLRLPGRTAHLLLSSAPGATGAGLIPDRIQTAQNPLAIAAYLRAHGEGARLAGAAGFGERGLALIFAKGGEGVIVALDVSTPPRLLLADKSGAAKVAGRWDAPGGALRPGETVAGLALAPSGEKMGEAESAELLEAEGARLLGAKAEASAREENRYVGRWRKKLLRRIENIRADLESSADPEELRKKADALAASLHLAGGGGVTEVEDPAEPGRMVAVELDSRLSVGRNLDEFYRAARRAAKARTIAGERLEKALAELEAEGAPPPPPKTQRAGGAEQKQPFRRYKSSDGWLILVGKNRVENDRLVKEAKPWDLWLHAEDGAGAHVVIKKPGRESAVPERTLVEAAGLAATNSARSGEAAVDVMVAEAARVRKPKGAGPGMVVVSGGRTMRVAPGAGKPKLI